MRRGWLKALENFGQKRKWNACQKPCENEWVRPLGILEEEETRCQVTSSRPHLQHDEMEDIYIRLERPNTA